MLAKSSKHYIKPTAEDLNQDLDLVKSVLSFYYKTVRKTLSDLKCQIVQIEELGSFKIKKRELPKLIDKHTSHLAVLTKETFNQMTLKKEVEERLEKVISLQQRMASEDTRKKEFFKNKNEQSHG